MKTLDELKTLFADLRSSNDKVRYPAFKELSNETEKEVLWVYEWWYELEEKLKSENSFQRTIGLTLLANLAKSDKENRIGRILDDYLDFFEDEKFITSRLCIQNVWKIAVIHSANRSKIVERLQKTYYDNIHHSTHSNLIKQDAIASLFAISKDSGDEKLLGRINNFIDSELDEKLKKNLKKIIR